MRINHPKSVVYGLGLLPFAYILWLALSNSLGTEPVRTLEHLLGLWGLRFFLLTLCVTPLRHMGLNLMPYRRALGLLCFFYAALHVSVYLALDYGFNWVEIILNLFRHLYIICGALCFTILTLLALTSNHSSIRRLGPANWRRLHRLAYPAVALAAAHFLLSVKIWYTSNTLFYAGATVVLLAWRWRANSSSAETIPDNQPKA